MKSIYLILILTFSCIASGQSFYDLTNDTKSESLRFKEAFEIDASSKNGEIFVSMKVKDGYYLYKERFSFNISEGVIEDIAWSDVVLLDDPHFGITPILNKDSHAILTTSGTNKTNLEITAQGCSKEGICYIPETITFSLDNLKEANLDNTSNNDSDDYTLLYFFVVGILISLTPCSFPLIPIIIASLGKNKVKNSIAYSQGLSITFITIGVMTTTTGKILSPYINHIFVMFFISCIFLTLGALMHIDKLNTVGTTLSNKIDKLTQSYKSETIRAFIIGMASGVLLTSCTAAPLITILSHLSIQADITKSAISLYLTTLGLATPLILIGIFGNKILLRPGPWMNKLKTLLSFAVIAYPVFLLQSFEAHYTYAYLTLVALTSFKFFSKKETFAIAIAIAIVITTTPSIRSNNQPKDILSNKEQLTQGITVIKAEADWCATCRQNSSVISNYEGYKPDIISLDLTTMNEFEEQFINEHRILGIPQLLIFKEGKLLKQHSGQLNEADLAKTFEKIKKQKDLN